MRSKVPKFWAIIAICAVLLAAFLIDYTLLLNQKQQSRSNVPTGPDDALRLQRKQMMDAYFAKVKYAKEHGQPEPPMPDPMTLDTPAPLQPTGPSAQPGNTLNQTVPNQSMGMGGAHRSQRKTGFGEPVSGR